MCHTAVLVGDDRALFPIPDHRIEKPQDVLKVGQEVEAMITEINFDKPKPRVSLSIRALLENNGEEAAEEVVETPAEATETVEE